MLVWALVIYLMLGVIIVAITDVIEKHYVYDQKIEIADIVRNVLMFVLWPYYIIKHLDKLIDRNSK